MEGGGLSTVVAHVGRVEYPAVDWHRFIFWL